MKKSGSKLRNGILGGLAFAAAYLLFRFFIPELFGGMPRSPAKAAVSVERLASEDPFFRALKTNFPEDWERVRFQLAEVLTSNDSTSVKRARAHAIGQSIMLAKAPFAATAPTEDLLAVAEAERGVVEALAAENLPLCAAFSTNGLPPGAVLSERALAQVSSAGQLRIVAARKGADAGVDRADPSEADWNALISGMAAQQLAPQTIDRIVAGRISDGSLREQCDAGLAYHRAIGEMSPERAGRIVAYQIRETAAQQSGTS